MTRDMAPVEEQLRVYMAGTDFGDDATRRSMERELRARLEEDRPLRVYCGFDPTKVDLHLGHAVPMRKLRQFQEFGHDVTFLIGNFTALIGDPTGKDATRPMLTPDEVAENAKTYTDQAFVILDRGLTTVAYNADWLNALGFADVLRLTGQYTVAQFLRRENFAKRYDEGIAIHVSELLYAMLQAYDALHMQTDVQIGGSDQLFNLMAGRQLQEAHGQRPQVCITLPILVGIDGHEKMSKSLGNTIDLTAEPNEMFGRVMSLPDSAIVNYYTLATPLRPAEVDALSRDLEAGTLRPMDAKKRLAEEITAVFHGRPAAEAARAYFESTIQRRETPEEMPEHVIEGEAALAAVLVAAGLAKSNSEVRRLVTQGAVSVNGAPVTDAVVPLQPGDEVRVGRHRFLRITGRA